MTIVLVRHAIALARRTWDGDDTLRPLAGRGLEQAEALVGRLRDCRIGQVWSSPAVRCVDTVAPLASSLGLDVVVAPELAEGTGDAGAVLVDRGETGAGVVLCGHGDNLPEILLTIAGHLDEVGRDPDFEKGSACVLERREGKVVSARYVEPPA